VERTGSDVWGFLLSHDILYKNRKNIVVIKQLIYNDISSTKVRYAISSPPESANRKIVRSSRDVNQISSSQQRNQVHWDTWALPVTWTCKVCSQRKWGI